NGTEPEADPGFATVIKDAGNIVLPFAFASGHIETNDDVFTPPPLAKIQSEGRVLGETLHRQDWSVNRPNPQLDAVMAGSGATLWTPDPDGMTRRLLLVIPYEGKLWMTQWLGTALKVQPATEVRFEDNEFRAGPIRLAVDSKGQFVVKWHGDTLTTY